MAKERNKQTALARELTIATAATRYPTSSSLRSDNTAPYQNNWNTNKVPKGQHTLTAVATDVAGNTTTSAPVTITIS